MKIEVGESLMLSWLRHVEKCQSVQLNWKPSMNQWSLENEEEIKSIINKVGDFFRENYNYQIFKKSSSHRQIMLQGEIDVLGLRIHDSYVEEIFAIDVAFHESGLRYGNKVQTVESVLKKLVRTSMILYGFFNMKKGTIIFTSPKIHKSTLEPLKESLEDLKDLMEQLSFQYNFELITNDDFNKQVLQPVMGLSSTIADTSELFLRSMQLNSMFNDWKTD